MDWDYPPENDREGEKCSGSAESSNGCMTMAAIKMVGSTRMTAEDLSHGIMMVERFFMRTKVPTRRTPWVGKKPAKIEGLHPLQNSQRRPYDSFPADLVALNEQYHDFLCNESQASVQLHLGRRNVNVFCDQYRSDPQFKFFSISDTKFYNSLNHGAIQFSQANTIK